jgi:hypothetical protein
LLLLLPLLLVLLLLQTTNCQPAVAGLLAKLLLSLPVAGRFAMKLAQRKKRNKT